MRDLYNNVLPVVAITPQTIINTGSPENLVGGSIDLQDYEQSLAVAQIGDIDELGSSPVGSARIEMQMEHSDDGSSWSDVALKDTIGPSSVTSGIVASTTTDQNFLRTGYIGGKRYMRVTLIPTGLTNGGPVSAIVLKGQPRHAPAS